MRTKTVHVCNLDVLFVLLRKAVHRSTHSLFALSAFSALSASQCLGSARTCPSKPCIFTYNHKIRKDTEWRVPKNEAGSMQAGGCEKEDKADSRELNSDRQLGLFCRLCLGHGGA